MKERPIIFSGPMIRAILSGAKTQTRRIVKISNSIMDGKKVETSLWGRFDFSKASPVNRNLLEVMRIGPYPFHLEPKWHAGDRLWVREAWRVGAWNEGNGTIAVDYRADGHSRREWLTLDTDHDGEIFNRLWIQSSEDAEKALGRPRHDDRYVWVPGASPCRWRPSIHMPRAFARIFLEIVNVRVERLQDISEADARAEGIKELPGQEGQPGAWWTAEVFIPQKLYGRTAKRAYANYWDYLNGPGSWDANPLVWVIEFKRVDHG